MAPARAAPAAQIVYVANADSHDIAVLALDAATGALHEIERFATGGVVMPLVAAPGGRFLYASIRAEPYRVLSLAIDAASGRLAELASTPLPASMCWISTDRSGRFLLAASYGGSVVSVNPIDAEGRVQAATQVVPTAANAHCIRVDPSNRFAFVPCLGGGVVEQWRFDAGTGTLAPNDVPAWPARPGSGPRHLVFHPSLPVAYLLGELDAGIDVLAFDADSGRLASLQTVSDWPEGGEGGEGAPWAADIHVTPDGRFVHACERRTSTIASFAVEAGSGRLARISRIATEAQPRSFGLSAEGRWLFAAGQASHGLARYALDPRAGTPARLGSQPVGANPNWVEVVELPA